MVSGAFLAKVSQDSKRHQRFRNPELATNRRLGFWRWQRRRLIERLPPAPAEGYRRFSENWLDSRPLTPLPEPAVWWLGHATVALRLGGLTIITDPHLGRWAGPVPGLGPRRWVPSPPSASALAPYDLVLISHNHYDHLDRGTIKRLVHDNQHIRILVPLGLEQKLRHWGVCNVQEMDWWEQTTVGPLLITCVPARHWSRRTVLDYNRSLWCGWMVNARNASSQLRFYFAGDTAYSSNLTQISRRLGAPDLGAIPIGAYEPRAFMKDSHVDPSEALRLHEELEIVRSLAIHWGTFQLSDEALDEPPKKLREEMESRSVGPEQFLILKHGEGRAL